jgi:hypothetical protein
MTLEIFCQKILATKLKIFTPFYVRLFRQKKDIGFFSRKAPTFCRKLAKIAENGDHNMPPSLELCAAVLHKKGILPFFFCCRNEVSEIIARQ